MLDQDGDLGRRGPYMPVPNNDRPDGATTIADAQNGTSAKIAAARAVQILMKREKYGVCEVEGRSVYGIALAMPQIARSAGWSRTFTGLSIRSYLNLAVNLCIQMVILYHVELETNVMNYYCGQMHLCSFGQSFDRCPDSLDCTGPGGSTYSPARLYSNYGVWSTRMFVQSALLAVFPQHKAQIEENVDPGEYGMESAVCRMMCLFLFVLSIVNDLKDSIGLMRLLWCIPTRADPWLGYYPPRWTPNKEQAKAMFGHRELDYIRFRVNGMPAMWKSVNFVVVIFPKLVIWFILATAGTQFLMETASIQDLIINSLAMTFILDVDELVADRLCTEATKAMMGKIEGYNLFEEDADEIKSDQMAMEEFDEEDQRWTITDYKLLMLLLPRRLLWTLCIWGVLYIGYFLRFCSASPDGSYISEALFPPKDITHWNLLRWMFQPSGIERESEPTWTMPGD